MDKQELLKILATCAESGDTEIAHGKADNALLNFIGDREITEAFAKIEKWYA